MDFDAFDFVKNWYIGLFPSKKDAEIQSKRRKMFDVCLILKFSDNH